MFFKNFKNIFNSIESKTIVLCYHRIAEEELDPWELAVTPHKFEKQLQVLIKKFNVISIRDINSKSAFKNKSKNICLTFDDGYSDNFLYAKPILEKLNLPACFFISSNYIGSDNLFWWDELSHILFTIKKLPEHLSININNKIIEFDIKENSHWNEIEIKQHLKWKAKHGPINSRCELYLKLWKFIIAINPGEICEAMETIRVWSGFKRNTTQDSLLPMTHSQLFELASNPLFTIGMHTLNHTALGLQPLEIQKEEITKNKIQLEHLLQKHVSTISYPYGSYNNDTINLINQMHINAGFTTERKAIYGNQNCACLGRFAVGNWDYEKFNKKLNNWFKSN